MTYVSWHNDKSPKIAAERGIARELIRNLVDAGYALGIHNGGDEAEVRCSINKRRLFENLAQAEHDEIVVYTREGKKVTGTAGFVLLVYYYDHDPCELIADYSVNLEETIAPALARAKATEARF